MRCSAGDTAAAQLSRALGERRSHSGNRPQAEGESGATLGQQLSPASQRAWPRPALLQAPFPSSHLTARRLAVPTGKRILKNLFFTVQINS